MIKITDSINVYQSERNLVNSTIIRANEDIIVVDTQQSPEDIQHLNSLVKQKGVDYIINTHYHSDHCYGNPVLISDKTKVIGYVDGINTLLRERNMLRSKRTVEKKKLKVVSPTITFDDNYSLSQYNIEIMHTPGHSPDSSVVLLKDKRILIAGDTVLNGPGITLPYYYWDNPHSLLESLTKIKELSIETIIPGHGQPVGIGFLELGITYLENSISQAEYLLSIDRKIDLESFINELKIDSVLPNIKESDLWVPKMHELNLQRLFMLLKAER